MTYSSKIRPPLVAGYFYPDQASDLNKALDVFYAHAAKTVINGRVRGLIVPHAGYMYSGQVAASGYATLPKKLKRFFIIASNHSSNTGVFKYALPETTAFETPLGQVPVSSLVATFLSDPLFSIVPEAHDSHVIEVQLPFLQKRFNDFEIVPIITGLTKENDIAGLADLIRQQIDESTAIIVSSDLSHYHKYTDAVSLDAQCLDAFVTLDEAKAARSEACGIPAALVLMKIARELHWHSKLIQYCNSGDTSCDKSRVVGYGAIAFYEATIQ